MIRLKIIEGDSAVEAEDKVNSFLETEVWSVDRIQIYPKTKDDLHSGGYYVYITYKEKFKDNQ